MAVKPSSRTHRNLLSLARPTLRETIGRLAPGSPLRNGLERILRGRTGALIVLGYDATVSKPSAMAASPWMCATRRPACGSCRRWTAPRCCPATAPAFCGPMSNWCRIHRYPPTNPAPGTARRNALPSRPAIRWCRLAIR